jgi:hypothetical protein
VPDPIFLGETDPQGSEQPWIEGEGLGFADDDLLEVGMSGIEEVMGFSKGTIGLSHYSTLARQSERDSPCFSGVFWGDLWLALLGLLFSQKYKNTN